MKTKKYKVISFFESDIIVSENRISVCVEYCKDCAVIELSGYKSLGNNKRIKVITPDFSYTRVINDISYLISLVKSYML